MCKLIFLFFDGVGIGDENDSNPFFVLKSRYLPFFGSKRRLPDETPVKSISPAIGLPGIPQSATCQTAMFTGAQGKALGRCHIQGYPNRRLRRVIAAFNILSELQKRQKRVRYLNAYPFHADCFSTDLLRIQEDGRFWFSPLFPSRWKRMISVTTCMMVSSGQTPLDEEAIRNGMALYQDYSNDTLIRQGASLPHYSPEEAAKILFRASEPYDFSLYEYFQTDIFGHRHSFQDICILISELERLMCRLLSLLDPAKDTLILTSDHGNIEDFHTRGHTINFVPLLTWGKHADLLRQRIETIADITPAILSLF